MSNGIMKRPKGMTWFEFLAECGNFYILPNDALEDENVLDAVRANDIDRLREILLNEF